VLFLEGFSLRIGEWGDRFNLMGNPMSGLAGADKNEQTLVPTAASLRCRGVLVSGLWLVGHFNCSSMVPLTSTRRVWVPASRVGGAAASMSMLLARMRIGGADWPLLMIRISTSR
jgi:hypothetical protein